MQRILNINKVTSGISGVRNVLVYRIQVELQLTRDEN